MFLTKDDDANYCWNTTGKSVIGVRNYLGTHVCKEISHKTYSKHVSALIYFCPINYGKISLDLAVKAFANYLINGAQLDNSFPYKLSKHHIFEFSKLKHEAKNFMNSIEQKTISFKSELLSSTSEDLIELSSFNA